MNIEDWLQEYFPNILNMWKQSQIPFTELKVGQKLLCLKHGFSGYAGKLLEINSEIQNTPWGRIYLIRNPNKPEEVFYLHETEKREGPWYFQVLLITDEQFEIFSKKSKLERNKLFRELLGKPIEWYPQRPQSIKGWD